MRTIFVMWFECVVVIILEYYDLINPSVASVAIYNTTHRAVTFTVVVEQVRYCSIKNNIN